MKKILILLSIVTPFLSWGQQMTFLDSVNYYFEILLNNERDSINEYNEIWNPQYKRLNHVTVETDESKFVNPWKHIDYCIERSHNYQSVCHSTTNLENMKFAWCQGNVSILYSDPKEVAHEFFWSWKKSPLHYKFMIQATVNGEKYFPDDDYKTFKVLLKTSYRNYSEQEVNQKKKIRFAMVSSFTAWD